MPGRNGVDATGPYRYGFIGQENDDEVKNVAGASQYHDFRSYDSRLGRYMSNDPLFKEYAWNSPYSYAENRVIDGLDLEGKEYIRFSVDHSGGKPKLTYEGVQWKKENGWQKFWQSPDFKKYEGDLLEDRKYRMWDMYGGEYLFDTYKEMNDYFNGRFQKDLKMNQATTMVMSGLMAIQWGMMWYDMNDGDGQFTTEMKAVYSPSTNMSPKLNGVQYKLSTSNAPVKVPYGAKLKFGQKKAGYSQVRYNWSEGVYKYEARWHTAIPNSPGANRGSVWVVKRVIPGNGGIKPTTEFKSGKSWISGTKWFDAIKAQKAGTATEAQTKMLVDGHYIDN
jgi:RHS repeat-associated protein